MKASNRNSHLAGYTPCDQENHHYHHGMKCMIATGMLLEWLEFVVLGFATARYIHQLSSTVNRNSIEYLVVESKWKDKGMDEEDEDQKIRVMKTAHNHNARCPFDDVSSNAQCSF